MNRGELGKLVTDMITGDRNASHGDPHIQFRLAQELKSVVGARDAWNPIGKLNSSQRESLDTILTKISRIVTGGQRRDHWMDIAGYALIAAEATKDGP